LRSWLIGRPLPTADAPHQTIGKAIGLAVFASDALSSTAYATQELMVILVLAGMGALQYSIPLSFGIVALLAILTISYEQTIHAYPGGGGAYIVARDNLGELPALLAGAALLTDYILTVSVSISSAVAQITSAYPKIFDFRVEIGVAMVFFVMLINLRGVRESGITFSIPTYFFVVMMFTTVMVGLFRYITGSLGIVSEPPELELIAAAQPLTAFLILRAFSNGTAAVTGVEAISNGITAFKEPRSRNAGITLIWMAGILGTLLLGITFLSYNIQAIPAESETIISQLARTVYGGRGPLYLGMIVATTVILVMAANTAFADFPRLSALVAGDRFLPSQLAYRGSRLVYSRGILLLAVIASALIVVFQASVTNLIPLYAIGVFLSFTLSQSGMARRWFKTGRLKSGEVKVERGSTLHFEKTWLVKMITNGVGAVTTLVVMFVFAITKFQDGAWVVIVLTPALVMMFYSIHRHYRKVASSLSLERFGEPTRIVRHRVIIPIGGVHRGTLAALRYARTLSDDITAVHISIDPDEAEKIKNRWESWGDGIRLVILDSQYRTFIEPLLEYVNEINAVRKPNEVITIVVPQFTNRHWMTRLLHARTADTLRKVLLTRDEIVITEVPYQVDRGLEESFK
jgi:amino acid transporter